MRAEREAGTSFIVYDAARVSEIGPEWFAAAHWPAAQRSQPAATGGRAPVLFVQHGADHWAIRHYYRGGLAGAVLTDQYVYTGMRRTRSVREWDLLWYMRELGLPVPAPVAAHVVRGKVFYRADLITERLPNVTSLAERFIAGDLSDADWAAVGACIGRFHAHAFLHADLNAFNIQLNDAGDVFVLDWDRGGTTGLGGPLLGNLKRLQRSLYKLSARTGAALTGEQWQLLLQSHAANLQRPAPRPPG
ncbi:MAG: 3-deoxy-D-manno-octulosonic acid kinase [Gammaproteobacteria bacterium]|nr:3-deoxy-D-manno-octulosonic acid kinase [Gammaproteobacteria bacterium]